MQGSMQDRSFAVPGRRFKLRCQHERVWALSLEHGSLRVLLRCVA